MNPNAEPIDSSNHGEPSALTPTDAPPPVPGTLTEPPPLPPPAKPRVWPALAVGVGASAAGLILSVIVMVAVMSFKGVNFQTAFGDKNLAHVLSDPEMLFAMFLLLSPPATSKPTVRQ
jgi:hypothetical protein